MMHTKSLMVLAGAALGLSSVATAQQSPDDLRAQQRELQSDASARSNFQGTTGPTLNLSGYTQFQFDLNWRDDSAANAAIPGGTGTADPSDPNRSDPLTTGFRFANTKLIAQGNVTDEWSYFLQGAFATAGGAFALNDMYAQYQMDNGWNVQAGQKKLPFTRENLVSDTGQLAAERSVIEEQYGIGRAQGIFGNYTAEEFRVMLAFTDGAATQNTEFNATTEADYAFTGRGEFKWAGEWDRFKQFSSWNGNENAGMAGGALHYQDGGNTVGTTDTQLIAATIDATLQGSGWNVFGAGTWAHVSPGAPGASDTDNFGLLAQGGFFVNDDWELFARGTFNIPDDANPEPDNFYTITGGANWFITPQSNNAKLTLEVVYAGESTIADNGATNFAASTSSGVLADVEGSQFNFRAQLQLKF